MASEGDLVRKLQQMGVDEGRVSLRARARRVSTSPPRAQTWRARGRASLALPLAVSRVWRVGICMHRATFAASARPDAAAGARWPPTAAAP
jgi:hypothetical protein